MKDDYKFSRLSGIKPGVMFGLCKVYKGTTDSNNVPASHPILSAMGTCNYKLANFFVPLLK